MKLPGITRHTSISVGACPKRAQDNEQYSVIQVLLLLLLLLLLLRGTFSYCMLSILFSDERSRRSCPAVLAVSFFRSIVDAVGNARVQGVV